jgi:Cu(I)/Ag(I) efflux system periplasmic protein CusF
MKFNHIFTAFSMFFLATAALAAGNHAASHAAAATTAIEAKNEMTTTPSLPMASAEIRKIDMENKKITLKHGEIKNLDMPAMTMVFAVKDAALLDKLVAGDKVVFTADKVGSTFTVMSIEKTK